MDKKEKEEEEEEKHIIDEVRVQMALGTMDDRKADKIVSFMAANSTDEIELVKIFWLLVDYGYNGRFQSVYAKFTSNDHVPTTLKKYVMPLANNRPIPDVIEKGFPRWKKKNSEPK